jgi:hypothetical protein
VLACRLRLGNIRLGKGLRLGDGHSHRRRLDGLDEARRRQHRRGRLRRFDLSGRRGALLALHHQGLGENVTRWQLDVALLRQAIHELAGNNFLDGARGALDFDPVIALQQRCHFLTRRPEQLRDLVNPDC